MIVRGGVTALGLLALMSGPAQADWFLTYNMGSGLTTEDCVARGYATLQAYADQSGSTQAEVSEAAWSAQAHDLAPGGIDAQFICPYDDGIVVAVLLVIHGANSYVDRNTIGEALTAVWEATPVPGAQTSDPEPASPPAPDNK